MLMSLTMSWASTVVEISLTISSGVDEREGGTVLDIPFEIATICMGNNNEGVGLIVDQKM